LGRFIDHVQAAGGALLLPDQRVPRVLVARNVALSRLETIPGLWERNEKTLMAGKAAGREGQRLLPLIDEGQLLGAIYVETEQILDVERLKPYLIVLTRALIVAVNPDARRDLGEDLLGIGPERAKREITLASLRQHEWNISRVARELGLTRRTIYLRLARWGIDRERVPKSARGWALEEA